MCAQNESRKDRYVRYHCERVIRKCLEMARTENPSQQREIEHMMSKLAREMENTNGSGHLGDPKVSHTKGHKSVSFWTQMSLKSK